MPDFALAAAGAFVFALTTWASLAFGYQVFQTMWETDQADGDDLVPLPIGDRAVPLLAVETIDGEAVRPNDFPRAAAPTA